MGTGRAQLACGLEPATRIAAGVAMALAATAAWAQVPGEKTVDGVKFRIGVAPVEQIVSLPSGRMERMMHAHPERDGTDHLVIVLSDEHSGARLEQARVVATVAKLGMGEEHRTLDRMEIAGGTSWGGYFDLRAPGPYVIRVEALLPGRRSIVADFDYRNR